LEEERMFEEQLQEEEDEKEQARLMELLGNNIKGKIGIEIKPANGEEGPEFPRFE
jgi:hypothetical protein